MKLNKKQKQALEYMQNPGRFDFKTNPMNAPAVLITAIVYIGVLVYLFLKHG